MLSTVTTLLHIVQVHLSFNNEVSHESDCHITDICMKFQVLQQLWIIEQGRWYIDWKHPFKLCYKSFLC